MKVIIFIILVALQMQAQFLTYPNGKVEKFVLQSDKSRTILSNQNRIYYKNGIKSKRMRYEDTRKLYVSFGKERDLVLFSQKYNLKVVKITNQKFYTVLFALRDNSDIIVLCSKINVNEKVRYAKPHWKAPRYTK